MRLPAMHALLQAFGLASVPEWRGVRTHSPPASKRGNTGVPAARRAKNKRK